MHQSLKIRGAGGKAAFSEYMNFAISLTWQFTNHLFSLAFNLDVLQSTKGKTFLYLPCLSFHSKVVCERYMSHGLSPNLSPAAPFYDEFRSHEQVLDCDSIVTIAI